MRMSLPVLAAATVILTAACASVNPPPPSAAEIARLESRRSADPADREAVAELAHAYQRAGRLPEARDLLEEALAARPADAELWLMLGSVREEMEDFAGAREMYLAYIEQGPSERMKERLQRRLAMLERSEMLAEIRQVVQQEGQGVVMEPEPGTVAVYPFLYHGTDEELAPLGRALAELLITDLSQTSRLRVLERARVQMLLNELQLAEQGYVDPATAARSGRLLRAEHVVQGRVGGVEEGMELEAAVMEVGEARALGSVSERDALQSLFAAERRLALGIYRALGIQLTQAEEARVGQSPTQNLQALLAFGRALAAEDRGDFRTAAQQFRQAARLDPGFGLANQRADRAAEIEQAQQVTAQTLTQALTAPVETIEATALETLPIPDPSGRDAAAEAFETEGLVSRAILRIILSRPN